MSVNHAHDAVDENYLDHLVDLADLLHKDRERLKHLKVAFTERMHQLHPEMAMSDISGLWAEVGAKLAKRIIDAT